MGSTGAKRRKNAIAGQFAARPIAMLESAAYRVLSRAAHQILSRLEIELAHHGGKDNGLLPCTFDHFEEYGLHSRMIAPAIREAVGLGFVEVTRKGAAGNAEFRQSSLYRITWRPAYGAVGDGTHDYLKFKTTEEAENVAKAVRQERDPHAVAIGKIRKSACTK